jgi:putative hydrolase of HD superfamily
VSADKAALAATLLEVAQLKALPRAGWVRQGVPAPESVAAHSFGVAWLAVILCPPDLDRLRVLEIALLHDVPEVRAGDITPHDGVGRDEKRRLEAAAAAGLLGGLPRALAAWADYEAGESPEARFVHELDKLDMGLQALVYARQHPNLELDELRASADRGLRDPGLRAVWAAAQRVPAAG